MAKLADAADLKLSGLESSDTGLHTFRQNQFYWQS